MGTGQKTNKHTNKQNKHVLDLEYVSQIKSDLHEIFRVYFCGCPKMIKIKNKSINKLTNKQTNKHFYILNISAKSSRISTKFSGELSVGVPKRLKQKNKQIYKQTNKQTNKHFRTYISQPNQVRSS